MLTTVPAQHHGDEAGDATIFLTVRPASLLARWKESVHSLLWPPHVPSYALAGTLIVVAWAGWLGSVRHYQHEVTRQRSLIAKLDQDRVAAEAALASWRQQLALAPPEAKAPPTYRLLPDSFSVRGQGNPEIPVIVFPRNAFLAQIQLPVYGAHRQTFYRATLRLFSSRREVLREDLLRPAETKNGPSVVFALPYASTENGKRYVITLESMNAGAPQRAGDFSFYAHKP